MTSIILILLLIHSTILSPINDYYYYDRRTYLEFRKSSITSISWRSQIHVSVYSTVYLQAARPIASKQLLLTPHLRESGSEKMLKEAHKMKTPAEKH